MSDLIRMDGNYTTRDGRTVRILAVVPESTDEDRIVVATVTNSGGEVSIEMFDKFGLFFSKGGETTWDLVPANTAPCPHCHGTGRVNVEPAQASETA